MHEMGEVGLATGWGEAYGESNTDVFFVVARGWAGVSDFGIAVKTQEFNEAKDILMGWNAPFELVSLPSASLGVRDGEIGS